MRGASSVPGSDDTRTAAGVGVSSKVRSGITSTCAVLVLLQLALYVLTRALGAADVTDQINAALFLIAATSALLATLGAVRIPPLRLPLIVLLVASVVSLVAVDYSSIGMVAQLPLGLFIVPILIGFFPKRAK